MNLNQSLNNQNIYSNQNQIFSPQRLYNPIKRSNEQMNKSSSQLYYKNSPVTSFIQHPVINNVCSLAPQKYKQFNQQNIFYRPNQIPIQRKNIVINNQRIISSHNRIRSISPVPVPVKFQKIPNNAITFVRNSIANPTISRTNQKQDISKYEAARWQNKYQDLKIKYIQLQAILKNNSQNSPSWILQKQNSMLKQKIKNLQQRNFKIYEEIYNKLQKNINFHKQTLTQQCQLLIDRFRLQNKVLDKI